LLIFSLFKKREHHKHKCDSCGTVKTGINHSLVYCICGKEMRKLKVNVKKLSILLFFVLLFCSCRTTCIRDVDSDYGIYKAEAVDR